MAYFFIVFLSIYSLANYYVFRRTLQALDGVPGYVQGIMIGVFVLGTFSYLLSKSVLSKMNNILYDFILWFGSVWFAVVLYSLLICALLDVLRLVRLLIISLMKNQAYIPVPSGLTILVVAAFLLSLCIGYGIYNFKNIKVKDFSFTMKNKQKAGSSLKILFFSDAHFTTVNNSGLVNQIVEIYNREKPDLILMGGDIIDDKILHLDRHRIGEKLELLKPPFGVFTCPGNHEYISGYTESAKFLEKHGVKVSRDTVIRVGDYLQVIGRDDTSGYRLWGEYRKSLKELVAGTDKSIPTIVLDHQPFKLQSAADAGVDLQLSGHTHNGQMFPFNLITKKMYEVSWGYKQIGKTHFYISSGIGGWGPPVRIGSDAEAIIIKINFVE